jgi:hypothetical protein
MSLYAHLQENDTLHECIICLKNTASTINKNIITYSCGHKYHHTCIHNWVQQSGNVIDHCISCDTVREYVISRSYISTQHKKLNRNQKGKRQLKKRFKQKQKQKQKSQCCMIQ